MEYLTKTCVAAYCTNIKEIGCYCRHHYNRIKYNGRKRNKKWDEKLTEIDTINNVDHSVLFSRFKKLDNLVTL